jgi:alanine-glyoxylate transaminase/serine-glyoxylate transaminase/serine-pyruvate transaminase
VVLSDRVLMGPGPSNLYPEVISAFTRPLLGHLDPEFLEVLDETCDRLRGVYRTENALTLPVSGTGSAGMEAAFVNTVGPGDAVVVGVNGLFGERMCEVAGRLGAEVVRVDAPWGEPLDPDALIGAHRAPAVIALVHAETSTGVRNDVEAVARGKGDALLLVDAVTSLGGIEFDADGWGVDLSYSGTQKCLGVPPGLSPLTVSARARARLKDRPPSWYFDLGLIARYVEGEGGRTYHHTAPVSMVFALHAGLGVLLEEGLENAWGRHAACGHVLQGGLEKLGFELVAPAEHRLPQLTTVWVPDDLGGSTEADVRGALLRRYGIEIGAGVGVMAGRAWRIGCMGHTARMRNVELLLGALGEVLGR